jgi:hypothetical protein
MITQIRFTRIAAEKRIPILSIDSNEMVHVVNVIDKTLASYGLNPRLISYLWNVHDTEQCYARMFTSGYNRIVAEFQVYNVAPKVYSVNETGATNANTDS